MKSFFKQVNKLQLTLILFISLSLIIGFVKLNSFLDTYMSELTLNKIQKEIDLTVIKEELNSDAIYYDSLVYDSIVPTEGKYLVYIYPFINEDDTLDEIKNRVINGSNLASKGTQDYYLAALKNIDARLDKDYHEDVDVEIYLRKEKTTLIGSSSSEGLNLYID